MFESRFGSCGVGGTMFEPSLASTVGLGGVLFLALARRRVAATTLIPMPGPSPSMKWSMLVAVALVFSGCASTAPTAQDIHDEVPALTSAPVRDYLHNVSQILQGITTVTENFRTPITELMQLDTWIIRPVLDGPVPLVLEVTPYYAGGEPASLGRVGAELVARGYAVGVSSVRGTGNSGGCFTQGGSEEARDTSAVIEHMASQEWSNGNVGLMGVSYPGTTPQDVWVEAPPSLKTIVPISGISDLYKYNFVNGVPINVQGFGFNAYYWALVGVGAPPFGGTSPTQPQQVPGAVAGEACQDQIDVQFGGASSTLDGNKDAYWQERDFHAELRDSWEDNPDRASVFYIHGLQDWNVKPHNMEDWLSAIQETGVAYKIWLGQWGHAWPSPSGASSTCDFDADAGRGASCRADWWGETMVAWFDQFLKGIDTGILDAPAVQIQDDDGVWHHERTFPPDDAMWHRFALGAEQQLDASGTGHTGQVTYHDANGGAVDRSAVPLPLPGGNEPTRVLWRTEPLSSNWTISGLPVFHGNVTADSQRASLMLSLAEELPDGTLRSFNYAAMSLNHVKSLASGDADIAGERQEVEVRFFPQMDVVHAGNRIVLIASGNLVGSPGPSLQPVSDGGLITIDVAGAWLDLPVDHGLVVESPQPYANL